MTPRSTSALLLALLVAPGLARGSCNVVPSADRTFPSVLGAASRPFARPGDVVVISRDGPVFAGNPGGNLVRVRFMPPDGVESLVGPAVVLPPEPGSLCPPSACVPSGCRCLRFAFPDTDAAVRDPADRRTLTGPVRITVETGGQEVARIDQLFLPGSGFRDDLFPVFVALPPANRFADLLGGNGGEVLAAEDNAGNLFVPFDFDGVIPIDERRTRFLEAVVPGLAGTGAVGIDVFTVAGQRLPPLARHVLGDQILGTADARESVLRIENGALRPGLSPLDGKGPVSIARVAGVADPQKQADPETIVVGERFAVYEARECEPQPVDPSRCVDLNGDTDQTDYFLLALDLTVPGATPVVVDEVDASEFPSYPASFPPFSLYSFTASDAVVAFRIPEESFNLNGNAVTGELLHTGAFDLDRGERIALADGSPRQELAGSLLAFSVAQAPGEPDALWWYDAARGSPGPFPVLAPTQVPYRVTRFPTGGLSRGARVHPYDLAVNGRHLAFGVPEDFRGEDVTGDGEADDVALLVLDTQTGVVTNPGQPLAAVDPGETRLAASPRWLAFQARQQGQFGSVLIVGVLDFEDPAALPRFVCDDPLGQGLLVPAISDSMIPCVKLGQLRVLSPSMAKPDEGAHDLGIALGSVSEVQVSRDVLAIAVDEAVQLEDLNLDGDFGDHVLHTFNARTGVLTNFRLDVLRSEPPFLQFIRRGLVTIAQRATLLRTIFRDVDEDGTFEEPTVGPGGTAVIADNCPTVSNPDQKLSTLAGVGEACRCPLLTVGTVQAFEGSRVRIPVDLDPGPTDPASMNFTVDHLDGPASGLNLQACLPGPVVRASDGDLTCRIESPGRTVTAIINAPRKPVPRLGAGEVVSYEFAAGAGSAGAVVPVCILADSVDIGDVTGPDLCVGPVRCGEIRVDPACRLQGDCNCDGRVNSGDRVCLVTKFFDPTQRGSCPCEDCNLSGELNAADAPCITLCAFGECVTSRR